MITIKDKPLLLKVNRYLRSIGFYGFLNDEIFSRFVYSFEFAKKLNLSKPLTFSEKVNYLKIHDRNPIYPLLTDKIEVKKYFQKLGLSQYIIPSLFEGKSFKEIVFVELPDRFIIKASHGSGSNSICYNKQTYNIKNAHKKFKAWNKRNWYWYGREWPYKNIHPRILVEPLIGEGINPLEFVVYVFNQEVKYIFYVKNRKQLNRKAAVMDRHWNATNYTRGFGYEKGTVDPKPKNLNKMIEISELIATDLLIDFIRVDFLQHEDRLYLGELTLTPSAGFSIIKDFEGNDQEFEFGRDLEIQRGEFVYESTDKTV